MATALYQIIIKDGGTSGRRTAQATDLINPEKGASKSGNGTQHGLGGDATRFMRPINSVMNKATGGYWEQGSRLVKAGMGVVSTAEQKGFASAMGSVGALIIAQYVLLQAMKEFERQRQIAKKENNASFLNMLSGNTQLGNNYSVTRNYFTGKITYKDQ